MAMDRSNTISITALALFSVLFTGCATRTPQDYLDFYQIQQPKVDDFVACKSSGCRRTSGLAYSKEEWSNIHSVFTPAPTSAAQEREQIRMAIAMMEQINGPKNGTERDNARNIIIGARGNQLDCIAEATNTTVGLLLLEQEGLLKFHKTGYPQHRGFARLKLPHNTASVVELSNSAHYVVDSWFHSNGQLPEVVLVDEWKAGFKPNDTK